MLSRLLIALLVLPFVAYAQFPVSPNAYTENGQRTGQWTLLYDSTFDHVVSDPDSAFYYRLVRFENGKPSGKVRDFYRSGQKQWDGYMISINPDLNDGESRHYHRNGKISAITYYKNGIAEGPYREYSVKGELTAEGQFENNKTTGKWTYYYPGGKKSGEYERLNGLEQGSSISWYESGKVLTKGKMVNGNREGVWERYFESGNLQWRSNYVQGSFHGYSEEYYDNGQLREKGQCKEGFYDGFWIHYHDNGKKESEGEYVRGRKTGIWKEYDTEGTLNTIVEMVDGTRNGAYTGYHKNGKTYCTGFYKDGHYSGKWTFLTDTGVIESEGNYYETDSLEGIWSYYYANGKLKATGLYEQNLRSGKWSYYFEQGKLKSEENFVRGELQGPVTQYYENGTVAGKKHYDQGKLHGEHTAYHTNGQLKEKSEYDHEVKTGEWISYYSDGSPDERKSYVNGVLNGVFESRYENGIMFESGMYAMGEKTGAWKKFYKTGTLRKTEKYEKGRCSWIGYHPNGVKEYVSQGIVTKGGIQEHGLKREYFANGQLSVEGHRINGYAEGKYTFYDSATGRKTSRGNYRRERYDGEWKFYDSKGKVKASAYYVNGFRETVPNVRDSIARLIAVKDFTAATEKMVWLRKVLKRDAPPGDILWTALHRYQADIYYHLKEYDKALAEYQLFSEAVKRIESDTTYRYQIALNGLANSYSGLKQYTQAWQINEQLLERSVNDPDNYPVYMYNTAIALYNLKREKEGEARLIKLREEYTKTYGPDHEYTFSAINRLAQYQAEFLDKYYDAIKLYKEICQGVDQKNELYLIALRAISKRYTNLDSISRSNEWLQRSVDYQAAHGLDKYKAYFENVAQLTEHYFSMGQYEAASAVLLKGMESIQKYGKAQSMEFARLLNVASKILTEVNYDAKLSIEYGEKAKVILEKIGEENSDLYEKVLSQLAASHFDSPLTNKEAEKYYTRLIGLSIQKYGKSSYNYYTSVMLLANYYTSGFKLHKSDSILSSISDVKQRFDSTVNLGAYYERMLGDLYYFQNKYSEALKHYTASGDFYLKKEGPYSKLYARALSNQASVMSSWNKKAEAEMLMRKTVAIFENNKETRVPEYLDLKEKLADYLRDQFLYAEAEELYRYVLQSTRELYGEDHEKYRSMLLTIGLLQVKMGEYTKAENNFRSLETLAFKNSSGPNELNYFKALRELASIKVLKKDMEAAFMYYRKAKTAGSYYPDDIQYYYFLIQYANFCSANSRYLLAESQLLEALQLAKRIDGENNGLYASVCSELANVCQQLGKNKDAEKMISVALAFAEGNKSDNEESYITTLKSMAMNLKRMGRYEDSEDILNKVLAHVSAKEPNSNRYAVELTDMASLQLDNKRYRQAVSFINPALAIMQAELPEDHENILVTYNQLGLAYLELDRLDSAYYLFKFCVDKRVGNGKSNTFNHVTALHNLAHTLMRQGKFSQAEKIYQESFSLRTKYGLETNLQVQAALLDDYGMLYQAWGKYELAEKYWKESLEKSLQYIRSNFSFLSDYEKAKFWERNKPNFENVNTFTAARSVSNPAIVGDMYNYRLATKGILLSASNKMRKRIYASHDSTMIHQYYQWTELREQAAKLYATASARKTPQLDSLEHGINALEKELSVSADDQSTEREQLLTWRHVQQALGADEAAIEIIRYRYFDRKITDSVMYAALVITKDTKANPQLIVLGNGDYLESKAYKYYRNCILGQIDDELSYDNFWKPIEGLVQRKKRIYISLDGVFNQINLKTLRLPGNSFLMDKHDFIILSNTRDLVAIKARKKLRLNETASLIGNPRFYLKSANGQTREAEDRSNIAELPGTKIEIESVQHLLQTKGWTVNALVQQDATEEQVKHLPSSRLVHLATHGFFQDEKQLSVHEDPMLRSGILLTGAANFMQDQKTEDREDGILTAYEAANLSFEGTELVVLSACETARGEIKQGEGVYGLQRAFITAGAESLIMSLWKVDDAATQKLMSLFYQNLMNGMEKSEALTQAQRELKKQYPHPFYWGAFVMMRG